MKHNRRHWLGAMGSGVIAGAIPQNADAQTSSSMSKPLDLSQFQPKSALHAKETKVPKPRYPVIDVHTHLSFSRKSQNGVSVTGEPRFIWPADRVLRSEERRVGKERRSRWSPYH